MIGNLLVWLALVGMVAVLGWVTRRAWRSPKPALKWGGGLLCGLLTLMLAMASVLSAIGLYTFYVPRGGPVRALQAARTPEQVARGEHLAQIQCVGCHTQTGELPLSGGRNIASDMPLRVGALYPINLTPSGPLKDWSDGEIMRVLDEGVDRSGRSLLAMAGIRPARYFNEADKQALIAYLRTQPAVVNSTPDPPDRPNMLAALLVGGIRLLSNSKPAVIVATVPKAPTAQYGKYVVGWADCRSCHGDDLSGGTGMGPIGPNLRLVQAWTPEQFVTTVRTGKDPGGHVLSDEMPWKHFRHLDDEEMSAVYSYLTGLPPAKH
jgi:mono/diheme cytochrome c family protein